MKTEIYEKNMKNLRKKFPGWADYIEKKIYQLDTDTMVETIESKTGSSVFRVINSGKVLYLNGIYNPEYNGKDWVRENSPFPEFAPIIIVGIHDAIHIRNILQEKKASNSILIYEPSINVFIEALENIDISFLFEENSDYGVVVEGINSNELKTYFYYMITYDNMTMLKVYISPNYSKLFPLDIKSFLDQLKKHITNIRKHWNTAVRYTNVNAINIFNNIKYMYDGYSITSLINILPEDIPTIIVSAGPSLNKNIQELKNAVGYANIIATDTAMKPLLDAGIVPNLFVVVDGLKPGSLFDHKDISKVPMVTSNIVAVEPMKIHKGKKFFYYGGSGIEDIIMDKCINLNSVPLANLATGGSVANSAFSLGVAMGSETIIFVGQDLAMTNNKTHADGTFKDKMDDIDINSQEYFEVESVDGGTVLTRMDFNLYRIWFEDKIKEIDYIRVIDATEGGAKIQGTEIMTLAEAIKRSCKKTFNVKYKISRAPQMFDEDGKKTLLSLFENITEEIEAVEKKAAQGAMQYSKLQKMSKGKNSQKNLSRVLKQVSKINKFMETNEMALLINESLQGLEYTLRPTIYYTEESTDKEIYNVSQQGIVMLESIQYAAQEIKELAENTVVKFAKRKRKK